MVGIFTSNRQPPCLVLLLFCDFIIESNILRKLYFLRHWLELDQMPTISLLYMFVQQSHLENKKLTALENPFEAKV